ncbi:MAG: Peroxisome chaperone and import receptor [Piccolia ochrophora]|nr:MAG: Peroxisome chaperone and import receptor [Piccolia ochrophora]
MDAGEKSEEPDQDTHTKNQSSTLPVENAPDPDEDDLDDLDDLLDEFSESKVTSQDAPPPSDPGRPAELPQPDAPPHPLQGDDFATDLQAGMAELLGELDKSPEMQKQFEDLIKDLGDTAAPTIPNIGNANATASTDGASVPPDMAGNDTFQETIRRTMQRMQDSGEQATAASTAAGDSSDDILAEMFKQMQAAEGGEGGPGGEEDFSKMLLGMMEQLTNKEILYEPMKELNDKFPGWMDQNKDKVAKDDLTRYEEQQSLVKEIVARFEASGYSDENAADREYIVDRMQKMQAAGSPPADLVGDMSAAQEALNDVDSGCPQQ